MEQWRASSAAHPRTLLPARGACPVIVEGPFDAIAVTTAGQGRFAGLAPCGTALTARHLAALAQATNLRTAGVLVAFDADTAGRRAAARAYYLLCPSTDDVAAADLQPGQDPAHILATQGPAALSETLSRRTRPLADVVIDNEVARWEQWLEYAEGRINAMHAAAPLIAAMPPTHVGRQVARLASRLDLDHALVTEAITDELSRAMAPRPTWSPRATHPARNARGA
jgi:DNA primase